MRYEGLVQMSELRQVVTSTVAGHVSQRRRQWSERRRVDLDFAKESFVIQASSGDMFRNMPSHRWVGSMPLTVVVQNEFAPFREDFSESLGFVRNRAEKVCHRVCMCLESVETRFFAEGVRETTTREEQV